MTGKPKQFTAAREVPYSSIVGGGIMLLNEKGACVAQLSIMGCDKERSDAISGEVMTRLLATSDSQAAKDVLEERARQEAVEGWTPEHDDNHKPGDLAGAGACYASCAFGGCGGLGTPAEWPWENKWWKPTTPRRDLVKAAALIIAEIERLDRVEARNG